MQTMALNASVLEEGMFALNEKASVVGTAFELVQNGIQTVFCCDCCGCNDTGCAPAQQ